MKLTINGRTYEVELQDEAVVVDGTSFKTVVVRDGEQVTVKVNGRPYKVKTGDDQTVSVDGRKFTVERSGPAVAAPRPTAPVRASGNGATKSAGNGVEKGGVCAPMPGTVLSLRVQEGEQVAPGSVLLILEAMKMQNEIKAPHEGTVKHIAVAAGQTVRNGDVMVVIA